MQHPSQVLEAEYANLLAQMRITRLSEVTLTAGRLLTFVKEGKYAEVSRQLSIPQIFIASSFDLEAASNFNLSPAQGDPWDKKSIHVPKNRGPYPSWTACALDTYRREGLAGLPDWTWTFLCYAGEEMNGFGYRQFGIHTPYDFAGTSLYTRGKYIADGRFSFSAVSTQLGLIPIARIMANEMPELDLPGWPLQKPTAPPFPAQPPVGVGGGAHNAGWIQESLNKVLKLDPPLVVDNSYGRLTKLAVREFQQQFKLQVDGLAGPQTIGALEKALAQ